MKLNDMFLTEGTDNLYHSTNIGGALAILNTGKIILSLGIGKEAENEKGSKSYPYFLSTSRTKTGDYHSRDDGTGVIINLDGRWINQRYHSQPRDYWDRMWLSTHKSHGGEGNDPRTSESEERIFSWEPTMPITPVQSIHVLLDNSKWYVDDQHRQIVRKIVTASKKRGIPVYVYDNKQSWLAQFTQKAVPLKGLFNGVPFDTSKPYHRSRRNRFMAAWIELYHKQTMESLSDIAREHANDFGYYNSEDAMYRSLMNDFHSSSQPNSWARNEADSIVRIMRENGWKTVREFFDAMSKKWVAIRNGETPSTNINESGVSKMKSSTKDHHSLKENVDNLVNDLRKDNEVKTLFIHELDNGDIVLSSLIIDKMARKQGRGTHIMQSICAYADKHGKRILLTPGLKDKHHGTTSQGRLIKFYKKFGFVLNRGRNKDYSINQMMYRNPETSADRDQTLQENQTGHYPWNISTIGDGDFYIQRKGDNAGRPFKERRSSSDFAITVDPTVLDAGYTYYVVEYLYTSGKFKENLVGSVIPGLRKEVINRVLVDFFKTRIG